MHASTDEIVEHTNVLLHSFMTVGLMTVGLMTVGTLYTFTGGRKHYLSICVVEPLDSEVTGYVW